MNRLTKVIDISACTIPYNNYDAFVMNFRSLAVALTEFNNKEIFVIDNSTYIHIKNKIVKFISEATSELINKNFNIIYFDKISSKLPGEAVNYFLKTARYRFCLISADDVYFSDDSVSLLVRSMIDYNAVVGGFRCIKWGEKSIESDGYYLSKKTTMIKRKEFEKNDVFLSGITHFTNAFIIDNHFNEIIDENLNFYYEESDFQIRLANHGAIICNTWAEIYHSLKRDSGIAPYDGTFGFIKYIMGGNRIYFLTRNRIIFFFKHSNFLFLPVLIFYLCCYFFLVAANNPLMLKLYFDGVWDGVVSACKNY